MKLQKLEREHLKMLIRELNRNEIFRINGMKRTGNNHICVYFTAPNGASRFVMISNSGDQHAGRNIRMNVKRALMGTSRQRFQYLVGGQSG